MHYYRDARDYTMVFKLDADRTEPQGKITEYVDLAEYE